MRILLSIGVGVIGCLVTYFVATTMGTISELVLGRMLSTILEVILALGGVAITAALAFEVAKPDKKSAP